VTDLAPLHEEYLDSPSYTFLRTVGAGANGKSRLWMNEVLGIKVVSKTIDTFGLAGGIAKSEPRFLASLRHDQLVRIWEAQFATDLDPTLKAVTFTTTFHEGRSVATALEQGHQFSVADAVRIAADVLDALAYMHEDHRLLHRDVKPGNVMLDGDRRRGFLGDLGSAAELDESGTTPASGCTLAYRPPEYRHGTMTVQADLYGVGLLLLEMLNDPVPWDQQEGDVMEARLDAGRRALINRHYDPAPWVPPKVARMVRKLSAPDPAERPTSAAEALRDLGNATCVDWRRTDGNGLVGTWEGTYPPGIPLRRCPSLPRNRNARDVWPPQGHRAADRTLAAWRRGRLEGLREPGPASSGRRRFGARDVVP
jgi:eukaryotic-like serine/threonine-protein kinase